MRRFRTTWKYDIDSEVVNDSPGSVRAVVAEDGTVEESSDYYPYGMQMPGADGEMQRKQPYKFGGKEHLSAGGLNIHDFGPRALYAPAGQFASADPKCEDYPHLSPYLYCAANPVNAIDPTGMDPIYQGDGSFRNPYIIQAVFVYQTGAISEEYLDGIQEALDEFNNSSGYMDIDGKETYYKFDLSLMSTEDGQIPVDLSSNDADGVSVSKGIALQVRGLTETEVNNLNSSGQNDNYYGFGSSKRVVISNVQIDDVCGMKSSPFNKAELIKGIVVHEVAHCLGLIHSDDAGAMTHVSQQMRGSGSIFSGNRFKTPKVTYPNFDIKTAKIILMNLGNTDRENVIRNMNPK